MVAAVHITQPPVALIILAIVLGLLVFRSNDFRGPGRPGSR
jgi:hypothetical protein